MSEPEKTEDPSYRDLFDWKHRAVYQWKEHFPLQPVVRPRRRLLGTEQKPETPEP